MGRWQEMRIAELARGGSSGVAGGPFGSSLGRKHYLPTGVPVIRGAQLSGSGRFSLDGLVFVSGEKADRHAGNLAHPGDLIVTQRGTLGQIGLIPSDQPYERFLLSQSQMKVSVDPAVADSEFVYFALSAPGAKQRLIDHAMTAGVPHVNLATLRDFQVFVPDVRTQRRIAAVLSAFDELIDINERRIELLEDLARSLYREWFVHFRFPGHEGVELVESELGPIPEGWEVRPVSEVFDVLGGGTPSRSRDEYWTGGSIPWFTPSDLTRSRRRFVGESTVRITDLGLAKSSARLFPAGSVLMTSRATLGVLAVATRSATCNQGFIVIPPVPGIASAFVYEWLLTQAAELERIATGATFKEITKGAFKRFPFMLPPPALLRRYGDAVQPLDQQIAGLESLNRQLAATRDLLLPRLVTGRLDIADIDLGVLSPLEAE
jgi:type I restriction enzyme S subunit